MDRFLQHSLISKAIKKCALSNVLIRFFWVPSHDKKSDNFVVPPHYAESEMRHANKVADTAATAALEQAISASGIEAWMNTYKGKVQWAEKALNLANAAGKQFEAWSLLQGNDNAVPPTTQPPTQDDGRTTVDDGPISSEPSDGANGLGTEVPTEIFNGLFEDECLLSQTYG